MKPDKIFIHTDIPDGTFLKEGDDAHTVNWNRLVLDQPNIELNHIQAPDTVPGANKTLELIEHKSDFVRTREIPEHGGIYLDLDAYCEYPEFIVLFTPHPCDYKL